MAYIDELLGRGEQILYVARQHTFVLVSHILTEMLLIAVLVAAGVTSNAFLRRIPDWWNLPLLPNTIVLLICVLISLMVLISGFMDYLRWNTEQYVITDRRVIQIRGIFNKSVIDSSLEKITDVGLRQSILGRIFNFGTVEILTASGDEGVNVMDRIGAPLEFKRAMLEAKHNYDRGYGYLPPQSSPPGPPQAFPLQGDIQRTLEELAALRDRGILSIDEFEAKKRELLSRI